MRQIIFSTALVLVTLLGGCSAPPLVGGACETGAPPGGPNDVTITSPALECEGRTCLKVGTAPAMCTAACASSEDCGETISGGACRGGFACAVATAAGPLGCRKLCVCRDALPGAPVCRD